jgi:fructose-specific phosphotransferase system IIC component
MEELKKLRQHLLTGVSYAIPFVACGGILIALSLAFAPLGPNGPEIAAIKDDTLRKVMDFAFTVGVSSFKLMLPILAGYIAYSVAGKPGLVAGAIGGLLADQVKAGFLGALVAGLLAGYVVQALKKIPTNKLTKPIMPILVIPIVSSLIIGVAMLLVAGPPIASLMETLGQQLKSMQTGNATVLALLLGAMIAFDMGGPVNKAAFFFASALIKEGNIFIMGPVAAAICTPPLGMGLATLLGRRLWTEEQKESGYAALGMGMIGITEGAIPFAASDPLRVIPCIMLGSMTASVIAMLAHVGNNAPHGGPIVIFVVENKLMYVAAIAVGTLVTAVSVNALKRFSPPPG